MLRGQRRTARNAYIGMTVALGVAVVTPRRAQAQQADPWLGRDKALHFGASAGLATAGYAVSACWVEPRWGRAAIGAGVALGLGGLKELYDLGGAGSASWRDVAWDVLGAATGVGLSYVVDRWVWPHPRPQAPVPAAPPPGAFAFSVYPGWHSDASRPR